MSTHLTREAIDTNVLIRYLTADDDKQYPQAKRCIEAGSAKMINPIVLVETVWVLESALGLSRADIVETLDVIAASHFLITPPHKVLSAAIDQYKQGYDFADAMIGSLNNQNGITTTWTFDKNAGQMPIFSLLK